MRPVLILGLALLAGMLTLGARAVAPTPPTLERIHADPPLEGRLPRAAKISPGGRYASYLAPSTADSEVLELWVRPLQGGPARRLAAAADLVGARDTPLTEAEKMALERRRIQQRGITDYEWCGEQDLRVVIALGGDLHLVEIDGDVVRFKRLTFDEADPERDPHCDRRGLQLAYVKQNDLWLQALDGGAPRQLTRSGSETTSTGLADFIAAEEFDRYEGMWWSRDGSRLLALEVDESEVPVKSRMQIRAEGTGTTAQRYPAAGEHNARVQALVIDVATGSLQRLSLPSQAEYVVRAGWLADGTPWLQWLTRDQTELHLVEFPDLAALPRTLWVEKESTWVDVHDDFLELESWPLSGKPSLLWSSERSGRRQLWQIDRVSGASHPLTQEPEPIGTVLCANAERIVFTGLRQRGRARELFERGRDGRTRVIDAGSERRWRGAKADAACERLLVRTSSWEHPPQLSLLTLSGRAPPQPLDGDLPDPQLLRTVPEVQSLDLPADDGVTTLNAFYLPPLRRSSSPAGHAVIVWAYGGPQAATVGWYWHAQEPLFATWQARGFGVLLVDTRGSDGRGRTFSHAHFRAFGQVEVADLFAAARALPKAVRGVDPKRIGLIGWSYGGFLAARAMLDDNTPFAAAVAGAPVVDWTLYDTAYTERYLGLPDGGAAPPYRDANLALRASHLTRPLLLMHGTSDDNVLFEHSLRLIAALESEGKLFDTVIYPGQTHGLASRRLRLHADRAATEFLVRQLQP